MYPERTYPEGGGVRANARTVHMAGPGSRAVPLQHTSRKRNSGAARQTMAIEGDYKATASNDMAESRYVHMSETTDDPVLSNAM